MYRHGFPATWPGATAVDSMFADDRAFGTAPGQIASCVCPGDGCQVDGCAPEARDATTQNANMEDLIARLSRTAVQSVLCRGVTRRARRTRRGCRLDRAR